MYLSWPYCFVGYDNRQECGVRDERKRELEFLEKVRSLTLLLFEYIYLCGVLDSFHKYLIPFCLQGGNPLDFKLGIVASVSVQSTSITGQHPDQFVTRCFL